MFATKLLRHARRPLSFIPLAPFIVHPILVAAQEDLCGEPPPVANERLRGEIQGKAEFLSRFIGGTSLSGEIATSRTEIFSKYPDAERSRANAYFQYQVCLFLMRDTTLSTKQKLEELKSIQAMFSNNDRHQLITLLEERRDTSLTIMDSLIDYLNPLTENIEQLRSLRDRFLNLANTHIDAVRDDNRLLSHELVGDIHNLLQIFRSVIDSLRGEAIDNLRLWYYQRGGLAYDFAPEPGDDSAYDSLTAAFQDLQATVDKVRRIDYPGMSGSEVVPSGNLTGPALR